MRHINRTDRPGYGAKDDGLAPGHAERGLAASTIVIRHISILDAIRQSDV